MIAQLNLDQLVPHLQEALFEHLGHGAGKQILSLTMERVLSRPYSTVIFWRVKTERDVARVVSKTVARHPENSAITERANQAVIEYEILDSLSCRFREIEKCSVPRPLVVIPELETYVMEFVEGTVLAEELGYARHFAAREGFHRLGEHYYHCGRWLRHFQEFTGIRSAGPQVLDTALEHCADRLRLIERAADPRWPVGLGEKIVKFLREQQTCLSGEDIPVAGRHGDFGPWNVLVGSNGVTVLDFLGYQEDPVALDLIGMLVLLENERRCLAASRARLEAVRDRFLDGFGPVPAVPRPVLLICESLHRIYTVWRCLSQAGNSIRRRIKRGRSFKYNRDWLSQLTASAVEASARQPKLLWPAD